MGSTIRVYSFCSRLKAGGRLVSIVSTPLARWKYDILLDPFPQIRPLAMRLCLLKHFDAAVRHEVHDRGQRDQQQGQRDPAQASGIAAM